MSRIHNVAFHFFKIWLLTLPKTSSLPGSPLVTHPSSCAVFLFLFFYFSPIFQGLSWLPPVLGAIASLSSWLISRCRPDHCFLWATSFTAQAKFAVSVYKTCGIWQISHLPFLLLYPQCLAWSLAQEIPVT